MTTLFSSFRRIRLLEQGGWSLVRMKGSHCQYRHPSKPGTVTVAGKPSSDMPPGTLNAILKHAGLKQEPPMRYAVIIEKGPEGYGAYVPDLPGCVAAGESREEVMELIQEAIEFHIEGLREEGRHVPEPSSSVEFIDVAA